MFSPVVVCFGNHSDDVLDLLVYAKGRPGWKIEYIAFAPNTNIFHYDCAKYPERYIALIQPRDTAADGLSAPDLTAVESSPASLN